LNKTALIFGSSGQDGYYLNILLSKKNIKVINISRNSGDIKGDVSNYIFVNKIINEYKPNFIFHFAANSVTSHDALFDNNLSISNGTINILEATKRNSPFSKVFISGSAMQFKNTGNPIDEKTPFEPNSPYSVFRINSVYASRYFRIKFGIKVYIGYFFNHDSPLRRSNHINQKITEFVISASKGSSEKLFIGDLNTKKEFNFAGDIIEAIWILINQEEVFEAVIGSGNAFTIKKWIKYCFEKYNLNWEDYVRINKNHIKEYDILVSNPMVINNLGWSPKLNMFELADLMLLESSKKN